VLFPEKNSRSVLMMVALPALLVPRKLTALSLLKVALPALLVSGAPDGARAIFGSRAIRIASFGAPPPFTPCG